MRKTQAEAGTHCRGRHEDSVFDRNILVVEEMREQPIPHTNRAVRLIHDADVKYVSRMMLRKCGARKEHCLAR